MEKDAVGADNVDGQTRGSTRTHQLSEEQGGRFDRGEGGVTQSKECSVHEDAQYTSGRSSGSSQFVDLLGYEPGEGHRGISPLVREVQGQGQLEDAEGRRLQHACEAKKVVCLRPSGLSMQTAGSLKALAD